MNQTQPPVSPPLPHGLDVFLANTGWEHASIEALPGDASFRRYFRLRQDSGETAMLMDAPPPTEDIAPFLKVAQWLTQNGLHAPQIMAQDAESGLILMEDFGEARVRDYLDQWSDDEVTIYTSAVDVLATLATLPPGPFAPYSMAEYEREVRLFLEWYCTAHNLEVDELGFVAAWQEVMGGVVARQVPGVTVLRDYHAENIMLLASLEKQGLLDFQDALVGHPAYDLVSLLQDARRDVSPELEAQMFDHFVTKTGLDADTFLADYACLGAQRNTKIVGIFVRLWQRDGKPRYLDLIPRVWALLERDLAHPALAPVSRWFDANIPPLLRDANGGQFQK